MIKQVMLAVLIFFGITEGILVMITGGFWLLVLLVKFLIG